MNKQKVKIPGTGVEFRVNATSVSLFRGGKKTDSLTKSYIKDMSCFYLYWKALDDLDLLREDLDRAFKFKSLAGSNNHYGYLRPFFDICHKALTHFSKRSHVTSRASNLSIPYWGVDGGRVNAYMCSPDHKGYEGLHFLKKVKTNLLPTETLSLSDKDRRKIFAPKNPYDHDQASQFDTFSTQDVIKTDAVRPSDAGIFLIEYMLEHHKSFYYPPTKKRQEKKVRAYSRLCDAPCVGIDSQISKECTTYFDIACKDKEPISTRELGRNQKRILRTLELLLKEGAANKGSTGDLIPPGHICGHYWLGKDLKPFEDRGFLSYTAVADDVNKRFLWRVAFTPLGRCMLID